MTKSDQQKYNLLKKELDLLYLVAGSVYSLEVEELLKKIVKIAVSVTKADSCLIYVLDRKKNQLILRASKNPHSELLKKIKMQVGEGITGWVARENKPVVISQGASKDSRFKLFRRLPEDRYEAFLSVPIVNKRGVLGVINIQHRHLHKHQPMEINLLSAIGKLVAGALDNAILIEESLELKEALEMRKLIEKAKGILMRKAKLSEDEAYRRLRKESMDSRKSLKEVAEAIVLADKLKIHS